MLYKANKWADVEGCWVGGVAFIVAGAVIFVIFATSALTPLLNPQYWALRHILDVVR